MKILLVAPLYHSYYQEINDSLCKLGHEVTFFSDDKNGFLATLSLKFPILNHLNKNKDLKNFKNLVNTSEFDLILVIRGQRFIDKAWNEVLKKVKTKKILYQWDSLRNFNYKELIPAFDQVHTFDREDAFNNGLRYLPLFYKKEDSFRTAENIDLLFVGIWHSDRIELLTKIASKAEENKLTYYFRVYYPYYLYLYLVYIKRLKIKSSFFIHNPVPFKDMQLLYRRARCVVDLAHPDQTGLTMRTIETVGSGKKLLTTNMSIQNETFFKKDQIAVIDRQCLKIDPAFIYSSHDENLEIKKYEINNWVKLLING